MAYDANSIQVRDFRTAARTTPGMYIGADGQDAVFNCFLEILNNSCDEAIMGRGNSIEIFVQDNEIDIIDHGAGVPRGKNKDCEEVLIELYTTAHSSGKFQNDNYSRVRGMHGVGASTVCVCSESFKVEPPPYNQYQVNAYCPPVERLEYAFVALFGHGSLDEVG